MRRRILAPLLLLGLLVMSACSRPPSPEEIAPVQTYLTETLPHVYNIELSGGTTGEGMTGTLQTLLVYADEADFLASDVTHVMETLTEHWAWDDAGIEMSVTVRFMNGEVDPDEWYMMPHIAKVVGESGTFSNGRSPILDEVTAYKDADSFNQINCMEIDGTMYRTRYSSDLSWADYALEGNSVCLFDLENENISHVKG